MLYTAFAATHRYLDRPRSGAAMPSRYPELGPGDPAWFRDGRIWHALAPEPGEVIIHKPSYGAFYDTPLATILGNLGRDTVIICGTLTNLCCGTTARQAYERGFWVVVGSDVTATNDPAVHEHELMTLRYGFACVLTAEEIVQALEAATDSAGSNGRDCPAEQECPPAVGGDHDATGGQACAPGVWIAVVPAGATVVSW